LRSFVLTVGSLFIFSARDTKNHAQIALQTFRFCRVEDELLGKEVTSWLRI